METPFELPIGIKKLVKRAVRLLGYDIVKNGQGEQFPADYTEAYARRAAALSGKDASDFERVRPFTLTGYDRVLTLISAVGHLARHRIEGAIVECGVWKGGSMMAAAHALLDEGVSDRELYLFDTFEGMSDPTAVDVDFEGRSGAEYVQPLFSAGLDLVRANLRSTGYPERRIHYVKGKVEDTLPGEAPEKIALLRLDTDWYESTRHELIHLYSRVVPGGMVIIDDYGHFLGCRKAVDEFVATLDTPVFLNRIDYAGRLIIK